MPRKSEIEFRKLVGLIPRSQMTLEQMTLVNNHNIKPDKIEYYFGRRCEYWYVKNIKSPGR